MKISDIEIQNFRKLKSSLIDLNKETSIFVGSNNSGKTSSIDAMRLFLTELKTEFTTTDFTLSNWITFIKIGHLWESKAEEILNQKELFYSLLPTLDLWLLVDTKEIHLVDHILPSLKWRGGKLGMRFRLEPREYDELIKDYLVERKKSKDLIGKIIKKREEEGKEQSYTYPLWPTDLKDFLDRDRNLNKYFKIVSYPLNPNRFTKDISEPEVLELDATPYSSDPLRGLIRIDMINAQRGFSDPNADKVVQFGEEKSLSSQFREYYGSHINPADNPNEEDLDALEAIDTAQNAFNEKIRSGFKGPLGELEGIGYPGFTDPRITLSCKVNPIDGLNHNSAIQFDVMKSESIVELKLPEQYNGLGYQNLISMVFRLMRFRDKWMQVGKVAKQSDDKLDRIEPIHLVLVEEPEAHLHAQVQQVFIRKAYDVLRNHSRLNKGESKFTTQLIVSTHSSHIAHELSFSTLRYFKRVSATTEKEVPSSKVVSLSDVFGEKDKTQKFVTRYLKTTHCDLFFADGVILVEGAAERMLLPHFIKEKYQKISECYITILEIGGAHAHKLKDLINTLGIPTVIITDLDSVDEEGSSIIPSLTGELKTCNDTLKSWCPKEDYISTLATLESEKKVLQNIRVCYQKKEKVSLDGKDIEVLPYTFEDALVLENLSLFKNFTGKGMGKKFKKAINEQQLELVPKFLYDIIKKDSKKAEFALEVLYELPPTELIVPKYIEEGLEWLYAKIKKEDGVKEDKEIDNVES